MNVAVIGLGMEGKKAVISLLDYGNHVYASDLDKTISTDEFKSADVDLELGHHDTGKIQSADAVVLSPSLWNKKIAKNLIKDKKLLSDILMDHKSILTVGVTGTNGKTTTCFMINDILESSGLKVLLGGNAGGGFDGYTKLLLEAHENNYDVMVVEVCDMTLDFASYVFDFDIVVVTNLGKDHMNHHGSLEDYANSICRFLKDKGEAVLNENDSLLNKCSKCADKTTLFNAEERELKLFGKFNLENASAASKVAESIGISPKITETVLTNFNGVDGRTMTINLDGSLIIIGKTDNPDAAAAVFREVKVDAMIIGTPRRDEPWRYGILNEVKDANPSIVFLFPGLDNTTEVAKDFLLKNGFKGRICIINDVPEIVKAAVDSAKIYKNIFIGGNGQKKILMVQNALNKLL